MDETAPAQAGVHSHDASPADHYRWVVMAVVLGGQASLGAVQWGFPALGPALREDLGLSLSQMGALFASLTWGMSLTLMAWGALADRFSERLVIAGGLATGSAALAVAGFTTGFLALLVSLTIASGLTASAATSGRAVVGWFHRRQRGFALGLRQTAVPIGGSVAAAALPALAVAGGLRLALFALAAAGGVAALATIVWLKDPAPEPVEHAERTPPPLRDRRAWRLAIGSAMLISAQTAVLSFVVVFLHDRRGMAAGAAALTLSAIHVCGAGTRLAAGRHSDRLGRRIPHVRRLGLATTASLAATALLVEAPMGVLIPTLLIAGALAMAFNPLVFAAAAEISGNSRTGAAIGLQQTVMLALGAAVTVGFGALVPVTSWSIAFTLVAMLPFIGWWIMRPLVAEEAARIPLREAPAPGRG